MEMLTLTLVLLLTLSNVVCQEVDVDNWKDQVKENKWLHSEGIQDILVRMGRKPRQQYLGLIRRKGTEKTQTARKSHNFQTFVGLMGKRSSYDPGNQ